jgi:hypothetical protein
MYEEMEKDLVGMASVIILVSNRIGNSTDAELLVQKMHNYLLAAPPTYSPVFVSLAALSAPDKKEDADDMTNMLEEWRTCLYHSIHNSWRTNPRLCALAKRVFDNAGILVNSDNVPSKLADFAQQARALRLQHQPIKPEPIKPEPIKPEPIKPEPIKPVFTFPSTIDLEKFLTRRAALGEKKGVLPDGTPKIYTAEMCEWEVCTFDIAAAAWAQFVNNFCDSVASAVSVASAASPTLRKYALDAAATPPEVMSVIGTVLTLERPSFDDAIKAMPKNLTNAECNAYIDSIVRATLEIVCGNYHFHVNTPAPALEDEPIIMLTYEPPQQQQQQHLTAREIWSLINMANQPRPPSNKVKPVCIEQEAFIDFQASVGQKGVELSSKLWQTLQQAHGDLLAGASGYDNDGKLQVSTFTGACITFIFLNSQEDVARAKQADEEVRAADPALYDVHADRRVPRIHQHAQQRVLIEMLSNSSWTIFEIMAAICNEFEFPNWLYVPAGFCGLMEKLDGAEMRRQPVYNLQCAYRSIQEQFNTVHNDCMSSDTATATQPCVGFGGIGFLPQNSQYGLVAPCKELCDPFPVLSNFFFC